MALLHFNESRIGIDWPSGLEASRRLQQRAGNEFRLGTWAPFAARLMVGEFMTEILRKTASTWLPVALTAAVVGIGVAVATW